MNTRLHKANKTLKSIPKKHLYEIAASALFLLILAIIVNFISPYTPPQEYSFSDTDNTSNTFLRAKVQQTTNDSIKVLLQDGPSKGISVNVPYSPSYSNKEIEKDTIILVSLSHKTDKLTFYDRFRIPLVVFALGVFIVVVLLVGRRRGAMSIIGLGASIIVAGWLIVPLIIAGYNALIVSVAGAFLIAIVSIIIAHGFKYRTFVALLCILVILAFVAIGSILSVHLLGLSGVVDETSFYLKVDNPTFDLGGILIGGIVIAALGALDDVVTAQVATVDELKKANHSLGIYELFSRASSVGSEHIAALVNTLALVYVGAALPLIVSYAMNSSVLMQVFNSEFIATEILRIVIVSIGLVISVPVSTYISALILNKRYEKNK